MNPAGILDSLFLRRIGYKLVAPGLVRSPNGEETSAADAISKYRRKGVAQAESPPVDSEPWVRISTGSSPPEYDLIFELLKTPGHRKNLGVHQTPMNLAAFVVDRVEEALDYGVGFSGASVCDPACGSGVFLRAAWKRIIARAGSTPREVVDQDLSTRRVVGYDIDDLALHAADLSLRELFMRSAAFAPHEIREIEFPLVNTDWLALSDDSSKWTAIVGNPPYVRTQNQQKSGRDALSDGSSVLVGRFDLSMAFVEKSLLRVQDGGAVGLVLSNKLMVANYGKKIRPWLAHQHRVREIYDLSDSRAFGAAVLPMVLIAERTSEKANSFVYGAWEGNRFAESDDLQARFAARALPYVRLNAPMWSFGSAESDAKLAKLEEHPFRRLDAIARIAVGVKTTANQVFADPVTNSFLDARPGLRDIARRAIRGVNVQKWRIEWSGDAAKRDTYLLYPHEEENGRQKVIAWDRLPVPVKAWFKENEDALRGRSYVADAGRAWYEIWVPQRISLFAGPKIVVPDISDHNRFAYDESGFFCLDSAYTIKLAGNPAREDYLFLVGWLNSTLVETYVRERLKNALYGSRLRYMGSTLSAIPVPDLTAFPVVARRAVARIAESAGSRNLEEVQEELDHAIADLIASQIPQASQLAGIGI